MPQEIEAKFYLQRPEELRLRLAALGAILTKQRVLETNLRFDTSQHEFRTAGRVLRLRQDAQARLTYKDSESVEGGVLSRREIEFAVSDFEAAREFLEALGYEVVLTYEKYRTTYQFGDTEVMLDEMPYGSFVEIEGEPKPLRSAADRLGLRWECAIEESYNSLFDKLCARRGLKFRELTFDNFKDLKVLPGEMGIRPAD